MQDVAVAFLAAMLALVGWGIQQHVQRSRQVTSLKAALAVDISILTTLIRVNRYANDYRDHAAKILSEGKEFGYPIYIIHLEQPYFSVFEANASRLGELDEHLVIDIAAFYQAAKSLVDGVTFETDNTFTPVDEAAKRNELLASAIDNLCAFGENLSARLSTSTVGDQIKKTTTRLIPTA